MKWYKIAWLGGCIFLMLHPLQAADGDLDTSFNAPDGYVLWDSGDGYDSGRDVAVLQDGEIVVTGYKTNGADNDLMVLCFDPNGVMDTDFGSDGAFIFDGGMGHDEGQAIAIQSDNRILVAGASSNGVDSDILIMRLDEEGTLDPNFGSNGLFIYDSGYGGDGAADLRVQKNGSIVVTGSTSNGTNSDIIVMRLTTEGLLDTTFDNDGTAIFDGGKGYDFGTRLVIQDDYSIIVTGGIDNGSNYDIMVAKVNSSGVLDQTFGNNGIVLLDGGDYDRGYGVGVDSLGKILVTGLRTQSDVNDLDYDIPVFRLDPNGVLDPNFGDNGMALYDGGSHEQCFDLAVQCDDTILMTGYSGTSEGGISDWALIVLKYDRNGRLDTTFGTEGVFSYNPTENTEWGYGLALQKGKIVVTGQAHNGLDDDVIVLRLENCPSDVNEPNEPI